LPDFARPVVIIAIIIIVVVALTWGNDRIALLISGNA